MPESDGRRKMLELDSLSREGSIALVSQLEEQLAAQATKPQYNKAYDRTDRNDDRCVLCGKTRSQVKKIILGVHGGVCLDCVDLCNDIIQSQKLQQERAEQSPQSGQATETASQTVETPVDATESTDN